MSTLPINLDDQSLWVADPYGAYKSFLETLFEPSDCIFVQLIHSIKTHKNEKGEPVKDTRLLPLMSRETLTKQVAYQKLLVLENEGWNIYVCMNPFPAGTMRRKEACVETIRNLFIESDGEKDTLALIQEACDEGKIPSPHVDLLSSPGKHHITWAVKGFAPATAKVTLKALAARFGGDPASTDLHRVLRMPGFRNLKYADKPATKIVTARFGDERNPASDFVIPAEAPRPRSSAISEDKLNAITNLLMDNAEKAGIILQHEQEDDGGWKWIIDCPWAEGHTQAGNDAALFVKADGSVQFNCFHNHCAHRGWSDIRKIIEEKVPGALFSPATTTIGGNLPGKGPVSVSVLDSLSASKPKQTREYWTDRLESSDPVLEIDQDEFLLHVGGILAEKKNLRDRLLTQAFQTLSDRRFDPPMTAKDLLVISKKVSKLSKNKIKDLYAPSEKADIRSIGEYTQEEIVNLVTLLAFSTVDQRIESKMNVPIDEDCALAKAAEVVWEHICSQAEVFDAEGVGYFLFKEREGQPVRVSPDDVLFVDLMHKYGFYTTQHQFNLVGTFLGQKARQDGIKTSIRRVSHFSVETNCAYFAEGQGNLLKVSGSQIERVVNGTDGELFVFPEESDGFSVDLDNLPKIQNALTPAENSELHNVLFGGLNFLEKDRMTVEQKKVLMTAYILTLLLPDMISGKLILQMIGPSGSGKSFFLKLVGRIIVGGSFHVRNMPANVEQLQNQLVNNGIVFFDNLEHVMSALKPILCMAATGGEIALRELFTTSGQQILKLIAAIGWSATVAILSVTEIMNRSLVIYLGERKDSSNVGETFLLQQVDEKREALVAELLVRVQAIIRANENHKNYNPKMSLRMADFGTLILRVAREEGWEEDAQILLNDWSESQVSTSLQNDDISSALQKMIANPQWVPCEMTAAQVNSALNQGSTPGDMQKTSWKGGAMSLSQKLHRSSASYAKLFGMVITTRRNQAIFKFDPTPEVLAEIRDAAAKEAEVKITSYNTAGYNQPPRTLPDENEEVEFHLE